MLSRDVSGAIIGLLIVFVSGCDRSSSEGSIAADPTCADCEVRLNLERTLRATGVLMPFAQVIQDSTGRFYVAPVVEPARIAVFDRHGDYFRQIGTAGEGPGEFKEIRRLGIMGRDSLLVIHDFNRITVLSPEGEYARDYRLNTMSAIPARFVAQDSGAILALRSGSMYGTSDYPARWYGPTGEPLTGFGSLADFEEGPNFVSLTVTGGDVWFAEDLPLSLYRYTSEGDLVERLQATNWYVAGGARPEGARGIRERVYDLEKARDSGLWLLGWRRRESRESAPAHQPGREVSARSLSVEEARQRTEWVLDLIDPVGRRLITRHSLGSSVPGGFIGPERLYTYSESPDGEIEIQIWRISVENVP